MKKNLMIMLLLAGCMVSAKSKEFTPRADTWKDNKGVHINAHGGGILFHHGVYYWFGEHKIAGSSGNKAQVGVHVYASKDLYNWYDRGIALKVSKDSESDIVKGCVIERPKVIYNKRTKKFIMWFHLELKGMKYEAARTGVAIADKVAGPYRFIRSLRPNAGKFPLNFTDGQKKATYNYEINRWSEKGASDLKNGMYVKRDFEGGQMSRDMTLFVDDDDKAYHITSSEENATLHIHELTRDYLGFTGKYSRIIPGASNEAPAIFKHEGKYFLLASGCTGWKPNKARSAVADNIFGPWKKLGNPCVGKGADSTFGGQSTFILPIQGKKGTFVAMFDIWTPKNPIDGRYIWLPVKLTKGAFKIEWHNRWDLSIFKKR